MTPDDLDPDVRMRLGGVVRSLVDTKLLLGYRYTEAVHDSPSMEDMNAIQGQAANEFGQAKHLMEAYTDAFRLDRDALETRRDPDAYANMPTLDTAPGTWPEVLGVVGVADMAAHIRLRSFADADWEPLAGPAGKAIQEEEFHAQYLIGALETIAGSPDLVGGVVAAVDRTLDDVLGWFGPVDPALVTLVDDGYLAADPEGERDLLLARLGELDATILDGSLPLDGRRASSPTPADWDPERGRSSGAPDPAAVEDLALKGIEGSLVADR